MIVHGEGILNNGSSKYFPEPGVVKLVLFVLKTKFGRMKIKREI